MFQLRPYQSAGIDQIASKAAQGKRRIIFQLATGGLLKLKLSISNAFCKFVLPHKHKLNAEDFLFNRLSLLFVIKNKAGGFAVLCLCLCGNFHSPSLFFSSPISSNKSYHIMQNDSFEIWKDIPDYEGLYQVSTFGNIKSLYRDKFLRPGVGTTGYYLVILYKNGIKKTCKVHRLVALCFIQNPSNLPFVNHKDSNRLNNHISNLEWCNNAMNMQHCFNKGRGAIPVMNGEKNVNAKADEAEVIKMRSLYEQGLLPIRISEQMGYSLSLVYRIVKRKTWKHV